MIYKALCHKVLTDEEFNAVRGTVKGEVTRAKGLGALSPEMANDSMFNEANQRMDIINYSERGVNLLYDLMGPEVAPRKEFIFNHIDFSIIHE